MGHWWSACHLRACEQVKFYVVVWSVNGKARASSGNRGQARNDLAGLTGALCCLSATQSHGLP